MTGTLTCEECGKVLAKRLPRFCSKTCSAKYTSRVKMKMRAK